MSLSSRSGCLQKQKALKLRSAASSSAMHIAGLYTRQWRRSVCSRLWAATFARRRRWWVLEDVALCGGRGGVGGGNGQVSRG